MMEKKERIAIVTGANRGIGFAVAKELLKRGIQVIVTSRTTEDGKRATKALERFGRALYHPLDVTSTKSIEACFNFVQKTFGKLDILINNAGINYDTHQTIETADYDDILETFQTNTMGPLKLIQTFLPLMKKATRANIVNVSSGAGGLSGQTGGTPAYSLSKLGLNGVTLAFAQRLGNYNISVNAVCPGWVRTDMGGSGASRSAEKGAETIVWAALLEDSAMTGKFFRDKREIDW